MKPCNLLKAGTFDALKRAGGQKAELLRQELDKNLQPKGDKIKVGEGFGAFVKSKSGTGFKIDIPGIIMGENAENCFNYLNFCGENPKKGDYLKLDGAFYRVLSFSRQAFIFRLNISEAVE